MKHIKWFSMIKMCQRLPVEHYRKFKFRFGPKKQLNSISVWHVNNVFLHHILGASTRKFTISALVLIKVYYWVKRYTIDVTTKDVVNRRFTFNRSIIPFSTHVLKKSISSLQFSRTYFTCMKQNIIKLNICRHICIKYTILH